MSPTSHPSSFRLVPMRPRDPDEPGRTASTLELFFDLVFVAFAHLLSDAAAGRSLLQKQGLILIDGQSMPVAPAY